MKEPKTEAAPVDTTESVDDFFSANELDNDLKGYLKQMKRPVEEIPLPPIFQDKDEETEKIGENPEDTPSPEDEEMASFLDYTEEHRLTAEFMLIQLDKGIAFSLSMLSGMDMDRYRRREKHNKADDYEVQIAAALVKKYQMRLSLEWMLATAILMGYTPMVNKAMKDRREQLIKARNQENPA